MLIYELDEVYYDETIYENNNMKNSQRIMVKIIKEICAEKDILCESFSYDWILRLSKNDKTVHIYGYQFENNSATAQLICTDKCATSDLLLSRGIPVVEHKFFISPDDFQYIGVNGNWQGMLDLLDQYKKLICKPNEGTGGIDVFLVSNPAELEASASRIFARYKSMAISPFYKVDQEYRVIVLNHDVKLVYSKNIPMLVGDGVSNIRQLFLQAMQSHPQILLECEFDEILMQKILAPGESLPLTWKHNLGQGAAAEIITDKRLLEQLGKLALLAVDAVNVNFASVDIIDSNGDYRVLEINSGIMMEALAVVNDQNYQTAKHIYQHALEQLFLK